MLNICINNPLDGVSDGMHASDPEFCVALHHNPNLSSRIINIRRGSFTYIYLSVVVGGGSGGGG